LLQILEHGGGSDVISDRITHFLILSLDSGRARSWSSAGVATAAPDVHDCTVGVSYCGDVVPPAPSSFVCDRSWSEYAGSEVSAAVASAAVAVRRILSQVPAHASSLPGHLLLTQFTSRC
jgi:hypothetical protein